VRQEGKWNQTASYPCFWDQTTGDAPVTIGQFFSLSTVPVTKVLTTGKCSFLFIAKETSIQVGHVAAAQKLKANWYATQTRKQW